MSAKDQPKVLVDCFTPETRIMDPADHPVGRTYRVPQNTMCFDEAAVLAARAGIPEDRLISITEYGPGRVIAEVILDIRPPVFSA